MQTLLEGKTIWMEKVGQLDLDIRPIKWTYCQIKSEKVQMISICVLLQKKALWFIQRDRKPHKKSQNEGKPYHDAIADRPERS